MAHHPVSRRWFLLQSVGVTLGLSALDLSLEGCGQDDRSQASRSTAGSIEKELHIYNWSDYIAEDTVANFEKEFGVEVTYDTYESNEEMVAKLQAGATGYDIIVPSGYIVPVLVATEVIGPIDQGLLTNLGNLASLPEPALRSQKRVHGTVAVGHQRNRVPGRQGEGSHRGLGRISGPAVRGQDDDDG
jgi:spermidine/putrescine-binding protein